MRGLPGSCSDTPLITVQYLQTARAPRRPDGLAMGHRRLIRGQLQRRRGNLRSQSRLRIQLVRCILLSCSVRQAFLTVGAWKQAQRFYRELSRPGSATNLLIIAFSHCSASCRTTLFDVSRTVAGRQNGDARTLATSSSRKSRFACLVPQRSLTVIRSQPPFRLLRSWRPLKAEPNSPQASRSAREGQEDQHNVFGGV